MENKLLNVKKEWMIWVVIMIPFAYAAYVYDQLPEQVPVHWNLSGEADRYASKTTGALFLPVITLAMYLVMLFIPRLDPRSRNYRFFQGPYFVLRFGLVVFFAALYVASMLQIQGYTVLGPKMIMVFATLLIAFLGNYLKNVRSNYFVGIRTPWTLENPEVWKRTHALGGKLMFYSGIAGFVAVLLVPGTTFMVPVIVSILVVSVLVPAVYSYIIYKKLKSSDSQGAG